MRNLKSTSPRVLLSSHISLRKFNFFSPFKKIQFVNETNTRSAYLKTKEKYIINFIFFLEMKQGYFLASIFWSLIEIKYLFSVNKNKSSVTIVMNFQQNFDRPLTHVHLNALKAVYGWRENQGWWWSDVLKCATLMITRFSNWYT